jgi:hypothetical protein
LKKRGFTKLACMNNWWPSHYYDMRQLSFWWKVNETPKPIEKIKVNPRFYMNGHYEAGGEGQSEYKYPKGLCEGVRASGCGFKVSEPPLIKDRFIRYFTLLRLPLAITPAKKRTLTMWNFKHIATGKLAQFWLNGFAPETYTKLDELKFFLDKGVNIDAQKLPSTEVAGPPSLLHRMGG